MYQLRLNAKLCISCGICMDVCSPHVIRMRTNGLSGVEGDSLSYVILQLDGNHELPPQDMMTFPFLAFPDLCDGCGDCATECPVTALDLRDDRLWPLHRGVQLAHNLNRGAS